MKQGKKQIVFFCASIPQIFLYKIAKEFKQRGYETILLAVSNEERFDKDFFKPVFDKILFSKFQFSKPYINNPEYILKRLPSLIRFLVFMKKVKPYAIIGLAGAKWQIKLAHKYFFKKYPFIYFPYDISSEYYGSKEIALKNGQRKFEIESEKYCFEKLDGIIHKGAPDELKYLPGRIFEKIDFAPLQLNFFPYCSDEFIIPFNRNKLSKHDKEIHIVYIGGFYYGESMQRIQKFLKEIAKQKIHMHMYLYNRHISESKDREQINTAFKDFINTKYFHLHETMNARDIITEISKYDFGFFPGYDTDQLNIEPGLCTGNKLSTLIEAGLPFICENSIKFMGRIMKHYGIGIFYNEKTIRTLRKRIRKLDYKRMRENLEKARKDFNIKKHFSRLEHFTEKVVEKKNKNK